MSPRTTSSYRATNGSRVDSATHSRFRPAYLEDNPHRRHSRIQSNASHEARKDSATDYKDLFDTLQLDRQFHKEFFVTLRKFRGLPKIRHLLVSSDPKAKKEICREFLKSVGSEYWTGEPRQKLEERGQSDKFKKQRTNHEYEDNHAYDETGEGSEGDAMDIEFTEETEPPGRRLHLRHTRRRLWDDQQVDKDSRAKYRSIWKTISSREVAAENCRDGEASSSDPSDSSDSYDTDDSYDDRKLKNAEDRRRSKRPPTLQNLQDASTAARPQEDDQDLFRSAALGLRYRKTRFTNPRGIPRSNGSNDANLSKDRKKESARKGEDKARLQVAESHSEQARNANQDRARLKNLLSANAAKRDAPVANSKLAERKIFKLSPDHEGDYFHWEHDSSRLINILMTLFTRMHKLIFNLPGSEDKNGRNQEDDGDFSEVEGEREIITAFIKKMRKERTFT